jgi:zinc D-Ala-D-Ala dipeptidase
LSFTRRAAVASLAALPLAACWERVPVASGTKAKVQPKAGHPVGLTELVELNPTIQLDIRYATPNNFTGRQLYDQPRAFLVRPAAEALVRAHRAAQDQGYGLTIFDAYRPWRVTKALWDATPPGPKRNYVANPKRGSKHNRGCAVDLTMHDLATGQLVEMPSGYDEFTPRAHRSFTGAPANALAHRDLLERLMEAEGFVGVSNEWWHFDFAAWQDYPVLDIPFDEIGQKKKGGRAGGL